LLPPILFLKLSILNSFYRSIVTVRNARVVALSGSVPPSVHPILTHTSPERCVPKLHIRVSSSLAAAQRHASPSVTGVPELCDALTSNQPVIDVVGSPNSVILTHILNWSDVCSQPLSKPLVSLISKVSKASESILPKF